MVSNKLSNKPLRMLGFCCNATKLSSIWIRYHFDLFFCLTTGINIGHVLSLNYNAFLYLFETPWKYYVRLTPPVKADFVVCKVHTKPNINSLPVHHSTSLTKEVIIKCWRKQIDICSVYILLEQKKWECDNCNYVKFANIVKLVNLIRLLQFKWWVIF